MTNTPLNPDDEARLEKALEQSANGQVVSRGSFAQYVQTPLSPDARRAAFEAVQAIDGPASIGSMEIVDVAVSAYLSVAQPLVASEEELDKLPLGTIIEDSDDACVLQALERGSIMGTEWYIPGVEKIFTSKDVELPARVLWSPEVKS